MSLHNTYPNNTLKAILHLAAAGHLYGEFILPLHGFHIRDNNALESQFFGLAHALLHACHRSYLSSQTHLACQTGMGIYGNIHVGR